MEEIIGCFIFSNICNKIDKLEEYEREDHSRCIEIIDEYIKNCEFILWCAFAIALCVVLILTEMYLNNGTYIVFVGVFFQVIVSALHSKYLEIVENIKLDVLDNYGIIDIEE
jgi:hypothetical protein